MRSRRISKMNNPKKTYIKKMNKKTSNMTKLILRIDNQ
jgi:hypothetical protein